MIIDAHQHFWAFEPAKHHWINDDMAVLKQDFLPDDLAAVLQKNHVQGTVAVQADQSELETEFLLRQADEHSLIKGVVGWVDLRAANVKDRLAYFTNFPKLKGFRHIVQDEPDVNFMLVEAFQKGLELLGQFDFTYDILIFPTQLNAAIETVKRHPDQKFVLDHIAKPYIKKGEIGEWREGVMTLASYSNVYCKVSGMVTEADWNQWTYDEFVPYLDVVFEAFMVDRVMFGSDWPVCLLAGEYHEVKGIIDQYLGTFTEADKAKVMGKNAIEFYGLEV